MPAAEVYKTLGACRAAKTPGGKTGQEGEALVVSTRRNMNKALHQAYEVKKKFGVGSREHQAADARAKSISRVHSELVDLRERAVEPARQKAAMHRAGKGSKADRIRALATKAKDIAGKQGREQGKTQRDLNRARKVPDPSGDVVAGHEDTLAHRTTRADVARKRATQIRDRIKISDSAEKKVDRIFRQRATAREKVALTTADRIKSGKPRPAGPLDEAVKEKQDQAAMHAAIAPPTPEPVTQAEQPEPVKPKSQDRKPWQETWAEMASAQEGYRRARRNAKRHQKAGNIEKATAYATQAGRYAGHLEHHAKDLADAAGQDESKSAPATAKPRPKSRKKKPTTPEG